METFSIKINERPTNTESFDQTISKGMVLKQPKQNDKKTIKDKGPDQI